MDLIKKEILIDGMSCRHCVANVTEELERIVGIKVLECEVGRAIITARDDIPNSFIETKIAALESYKVKKITDIDKTKKKFWGIF